MLSLIPKNRKKMNIQKSVTTIDYISEVIMNGDIKDFLDYHLKEQLGEEWWLRYAFRGDFIAFYVRSCDEREKQAILNGLWRESGSNIIDDNETDIELSFEDDILHQFFDFVHNNKLELLREIIPSAWKTVAENNLNVFSNVNNWVLYWNKATQEDKELLICYIVDKK